MKSKKSYENKLYHLRELNSNDICDINKMKYELSMQSKDKNQMKIEEESIESQIKVQNEKITSMETKLDKKLQELDEKAFTLEEHEAEIHQYETQVDSFKGELVHL